MSTDPAAVAATHHAGFLTDQRRKRHGPGRPEVAVLLEQASQLIQAHIGPHVAPINAITTGSGDCDEPSTSGLEAIEDGKQRLGELINLGEIVLSSPELRRGELFRVGSRETGDVGLRLSDPRVVAGEHVAPAAAGGIVDLLLERRGPRLGLGLAVIAELSRV